jgi:type III restriction enzyme
MFFEIRARCMFLYGTTNTTTSWPYLLEAADGTCIHKFPQRTSPVTVLQTMLRLSEMFYRLIPGNKSKVLLMVKRAPARRRPRKAKPGTKGLIPAECRLDQTPAAAVAAVEAIEKAGGCVVGSYKEPLGGHPVWLSPLVWLTEAPASERVGIEVPSDGGPFARLCCKMATGSGKTILMSMVIAWQVLNKVTYPQDKRFSKNILLIAPGLTVKNRLRVLIPGEPGNYYTEFQIIPPGLEDKLRQGQTCRVLIRNWHKLDWESEEQIKKKRSVDKRGPKSDEAYVRDVLEEMASAQNLVVINDEAHHAWRVPPKSRIAGVSKDELNEATKWVGGLDRIQRARGILTCFDLTATPFAPTGKKSGQETLFNWIVSDFGLNDAIESGLVKTPRVVVRDDGKLRSDYKSRFYHIYSDPDVKTDVNRKAEPQVPLPGLVVNGYYFLGKDWLETARAWKKAKQPTPPVMITVANTTNTAARVEYAFTHKRINIDELCDSERILHIDSHVLKQAEEEDEPVQLGLKAAQPSDGSSDELDSDEANGAESNGDTPRKKLSKKEQAEFLRRQVDTVGIKGQPGEKIQSVISVGMLSEGWDAKTVTHIMGLRAFTSQLLCEQVVGRGLRRTSYETDPASGFFQPEYVNIFGVPFTFLPHEGGGDQPPPPRLVPKRELRRCQSARATRSCGRT